VRPIALHFSLLYSSAEHFLKPMTFTSCF
jgi:hypothetical protein